MKSVLPAPMILEDLKAAPRQGQSMITTQSVKVVLWTCALSFLAILMMIWLIPFEPILSDPLIYRSGWMP